MKLAIRLGSVRLHEAFFIPAIASRWTPPMPARRMGCGCGAS